MYGWRAKIGVIVPANNTVVEPELYRYVPTGVTVHTSRLASTGSSGEELREMAADIDRAVGELVGAHVDAVLYACLSTSLVQPLGWDAQVAARVSALSGLPVVTAAAATVDALQALGARRVSLATPYPEDIDEHLPAYFGRAGIEVVAARSLGISDIHDVPRRESGEIYALARDAWHPDAQALCLLATDMRTFEVLEWLERDLTVPVVATNQALLWSALRTLGITDPVTGLGTLLGRGGPPSRPCIDTDHDPQKAG